MHAKNFVGLMRWEFEEYLSFPIFEIIVLVAIYSILNRSPIEFLAAKNYSNLLNYGIDTVFLFLIFSVGAVFSHSFAGSVAKGEIKMLLSYPVKRWQLFLSKFITVFLIFFVIYSAVFSVQIYIYSLSPFEPLFYVSLLSLFFELLLLSAITVVIAYTVKNEIISVLVSIILLYGISSLPVALSPLHSAGRFRILFGYFGQLSHGELPSGFMVVPSLESVVMAVAIPIIVSAILLILSYIYFTRIMEVD